MGIALSGVKAMAVDRFRIGNNTNRSNTNFNKNVRTHLLAVMDVIQSLMLQPPHQNGKVQEVWGQQSNRSQPTLQRGQPTDITDQGYAFSRSYEAELGRNRSLPDIKPPSSFNNRTPIRGSSLTNPKSNAAPFHNRQTSQRHLDRSYQTPTAMSNEPITASKSPSIMSVSTQDAYGGTTDDWRQAQQAAREREDLKDADLVERSGHTSINSGDDNTPEPTQGSTSLAKATVQPGGILAQLQAATEVGQVVDPAMGIRSQDGRYIKRSNTTPYSSGGENNKTIPEEDESEEVPLEYSKSDGYAERDRYGIDLLPLPVIPSPAEPFKKTNVGILPQDVLRTLDSKTIQKVITQSVIASRMYKALSFEELEGLKKEQEDLQKYVEQINMSLAIETRMRDASHSLIRLHESSTNMDAVKAATGQLNATTRKMDQIVKRIQNSMERLLVIQRLLLQHEGAVLNAGMRRLDGENRELSRVVLELEKARDLEKEEKLKWRKEHSQLRIQSMIFPNPPGLEDLAAINGGGSNGASNAAALGSEAPLRIRKSASGRKSPSKAQQQQIKDTSLPPLQQQQRDTRLAALENYMKELNDEITKKDERVIYLESQLRMIKVWADDFAGALRVKIDVDNSPDNVRPYKDSSSSPKLQMQLGQLQARIEDGFRAMEANAHELCIKAHEAEIARNKALEFTASTLANTSIVATQLSLARSSSSSNTSADSGELTLPSELRSQQQNPYYRQRGPYNRSRTGVNDMSGLNAAINESLLELDQQISSSSSSSISLVSSGTPPTSQDGINKGSRTRSPVQQRQRSRPRGGADQKQPPQDDLVIGDANEEIRRLNAMVDELERLVKLKTR
ncbi:hypothetical protein BGZ58_009016 [Dissophora ornata]|nr:hypothetical protein BGZ58_009016 [Dissophora ornata]